MSRGLTWTTQQLLAARLSEPPEHHFNPRPLGVIRPGSATDAVLAFLRINAGQHFNRYQIIRRTDRSSKAVDWALLFLKGQGLISVHADEIRNPRYLRYSAVLATNSKG